MTLNIIIADDADLTIRGVIAVLSADPRYRVIGQARCLSDLLVAIDTHPPDIIVLNEWIYNADILTVVEQIRSRQMSARLIVMGGLANGLLIRDLFALGVQAYLYRSDDLCELLLQAVDMVARGRMYLSPTASAEYLVAMQSPLRDWKLDAEARKVLNLLAHGEHVSAISLHLGIDTRRVYWVREKLRRRFGARTNEHLIQRAAVEGFIYPRD
jgi:DNA-binding NarL/FixJ family response regulator